MTVPSPLEAATAAITAHRYSAYYGICYCQLKPVEGAASATYLNQSEHPAHVAAAVLDALDLQSEWAVQQTPGRDSSSVEYRTEASAREALADAGGWVPGSRVVRRLVSPWQPQEDQ